MTEYCEHCGQSLPGKQRAKFIAVERKLREANVSAPWYKSRFREALLVRDRFPKLEEFFVKEFPEFEKEANRIRLTFRKNGSWTIGPIRQEVGRHVYLGSTAEDKATYLGDLAELLPLLD